ncbi:MAG: leucine-rich repeat domain-containing protein, partial [Eubacteriales bacterium]|nr:leucine-rich repeat domain-containing protein [Eubacteriales bacterium]
MKRNVKISKIGTSMIAGVMIANNIPAITVSAEENTENAIISNSSTDNSQEITGGISSSPDLDGENKVEEGEEIAGAEIEAIPNEPTDIKEGVTEAGNSENVSDVSRNATITETNVTINRDNIELNADLEVKSGEINFNFDPFTLTGENNPTKERVEKASDTERYTNADNLTTAGIGDVDANGDGYYDLSEKLDFEIKYSIRKTLENLGKNTQDITYKTYTLDTNGIDDSTEIEMSDSLKTAVKEVLGISDDSELTYGRLKTETSLDLSNKNITDLSGIEYFTNLESLDLSNNQINSSDSSNLKSLLTLKNLKTLDLSNNQITTFGQEELANLTKLESVDLSNNQITVLQNINLKDSDNATLKSINLQGNRIATIQN